MLSLAAALEVELAKQDQASRQAKLGGKLAGPSGLQVALESHLEGTWGPTWTTLGDHFEAILNPLGAQVGPRDAQKRPKRIQVESKRRSRGTKLSARGAQEFPS